MTCYSVLCCVVLCCWAASAIRPVVTVQMAPLPKFGIEKEVRVCDGCHDKLRFVFVSYYDLFVSHPHTIYMYIMYI